MTPAEKLSLKKQRLRPKRNGVAHPPRNVVWKTPLRKMREDLNLAIRDVALAVGLGISSYWQIENGTDPMLTTALRIAAFFDQSVHLIWFRKAAIASKRVEE